MLFNSYVFIFCYLPATLAVYFLVKHRRARYSMHVLIVASLFFYSWWDWRSLPILLGSIAWNYAIATRLSFTAGVARHRWLWLGVFTNLLALGYFKYFNFVGQNVSTLFGVEFPAREITLPLGISFFTFTQIAFLIDSYREPQRLYSPTSYGLFVTYFPHLIAGPILHHKEMMPQFERMAVDKIGLQNFVVGLSVFAIGLFKKTILADTCAIYAAPVFQEAAGGGALTFLESWCGALSYTFQLYFDFSGYCDMAIGLSWLFGVRLPLNFYSPYKATSVIDFWRRWHMTLSRFLRDYLYISLGGNRRGRVRWYANLMLTMVLGGIWHGAGWTFVAWGTLHGVYLAVNHLWREFKSLMGLSEKQPSTVSIIVSRTVTFLAVVIAWVFFRAETMDSALSILRGMAGVNGLIFPSSYVNQLGAIGPKLEALGVAFGNAGLYQGTTEVVWILSMFVLVWAFPNTQEFMGRFNPALPAPGFTGQASPLRWKEGGAWPVIIGGMLGLAILGLAQQSEFLYFQF